MRHLKFSNPKHFSFSLSKLGIKGVIPPPFNPVHCPPPPRTMELWVSLFSRIVNQIGLSVVTIALNPLRPHICEPSNPSPRWTIANEPLLTSEKACKTCDDLIYGTLWLSLSSNDPDLQLLFLPLSESHRSLSTLAEVSPFQLLPYRHLFGLKHRCCCRSRPRSP